MKRVFDVLFRLGFIVLVFYRVFFLIFIWLNFKNVEECRKFDDVLVVEMFLLKDLVNEVILNDFIFEIKIFEFVKFNND